MYIFMSSETRYQGITGNGQYCNSLTVSGWCAWTKPTRHLNAQWEAHKHIYSTMGCCWCLRRDFEICYTHAELGEAVWGGVDVANNSYDINECNLKPIFRSFILNSRAFRAPYFHNHQIHLTISPSQFHSIKELIKFKPGFSRPTKCPFISCPFSLRKAAT